MHKIDWKMPKSALSSFVVAVVAAPLQSVLRLRFSLEVSVRFRAAAQCYV